MNCPCVYIIEVDSGQYYIGSTNDIERRMREHSRGTESGTRYSKSNMLRLVQNYPTLGEARRIEYKLKKFKNRKIIEKIIEDGEIKIS